jgi:hypothetical protein
MRPQTAIRARALGVQESLKILKYRFGREVGFRPVVVGRGVRCYPVEGKLRPESEIVTWTRGTDRRLASSVDQPAIPVSPRLTGNRNLTL